MKQLAQYIAAPSRLGKIWRKFDCCLLLSDCAVLCCAILCAMACLLACLLAYYFASLLHKSKPQTMQIADEESDSWHTG